ncbi:MAG: DUF2510 domain-containing protein [Actinobacteria bacterium]|nr:DUF2510 domain-containing protein [Actinomycetota bacterium]
MKEFASVKVSASDSDGLASTLTAKSVDGWAVLSIVSVREGSELVAFLSRDTVANVNPTPASSLVATPASTPAPVSSPTSTPTVPADWYKDPAGRYDYRYWDGAKWTEHVSRAGTIHKDPPTP